MSELAALREGWASLLAEQHHAGEAELVRRGTLTLLAGARQWSVGAREVTAQTFELALEPADYARFLGQDDAVDRLRAALAEVVQSSDTMLAELLVVVSLPGVAVPWRLAFRSAPRRDREGDVDPEAVRRGAIALLEALGDDKGAHALTTAELESARLATDGEVPLRRWVVRLASTTLAQAIGDARLELAIRRAVTWAATRADERVAGVELAVANRA